jgi:hypothetical protein
MYKKKLYPAIIPLLTFSCLSLSVFADDIQLKRSHPYHHVAVKDDSLLNISAIFLKNPWSSPTFGGLNRHEIKSPPFTYPSNGVIPKVMLSASCRPSSNKIREANDCHWAPNSALINPDAKSIIATKAVYLDNVNITCFGKPATAVTDVVNEAFFVKQDLIVAYNDMPNRFASHMADVQMSGRLCSVDGDITHTLRVGPNARC